MKTPDNQTVAESESLRELRVQLAAQQATITALSQENSWLKEQLGLARLERFGSSSEKHPAQDDFFNEAETCDEGPDEEASPDTTAETAAVEAHQRKKPGRKPLPKDLPRERIVHDLPEDERICTCCGGELHVIGEEVSEQLDIVPAQVRVLEQVKLKYGCRGCEEGVTTAKAPVQPIPGSLASPGILAYVITAKYCDALPLYRQSSILARMGIDLSRSTLSHWMVRSGEQLERLYQRLHDLLLTEPILHADETGVQVLKEPGRAAQSGSYMWLYRSGRDSPHPVVLFDYQPGRGQEYPQAFLSGFKGYLHADGYAAYETLKDIQLVGCWAHARRKFDEAIKVLPKAKQQTGKGMVAINLIQKLYRLEKQMRELPPNERQARRLAEAKPILETFKTWLDKSAAQGLPKSKMGQAVQYCLNQWPKLLGYLADGRLEIDNNRAEQDIRPFTTGRKNWLFSNTPRGAHSSAVLYSLVMTARANDVNPYHYLREVLERLPNLKDGDSLDALLPWHMTLS